MRTINEQKSFKRQISIEKKSKRIWEIDFIRGLCIVVMIIDHTFWLVENEFAYQWKAVDFGLGFIKMVDSYYYGIRETCHFFIVFLFLFLCGISCSFSKSNLKRGLIVGGFALALTAIGLITEFYYITFGILHCISICILLYWLLTLIPFKSKRILATVCFGLGILLVFVNFLFEANVISPRGEFWTYIFRIGSASEDYFPILPQLGWLFIGAGVGHSLYRNKKTRLPHLGKIEWYKPVNFVGRHGLTFYLAHQIVVYVILLIINAIVIK